MKKLFSIIILFAVLSQTAFSQEEAPFPTDHLQLWLRADSVQLTGGKVNRWYDLSANNYAIQQASESAMPTINESAINRYPAVVFNGSSSFFNGGDILDINDDGWIYFIVGKFASKTYSTTAVPPFVGKYNRTASDWSAGNHWYLCGNEIVIRENSSTKFINTNASKATYQIFGYELYNRETNLNNIYINNNQTNSQSSTSGTKDNNVSFQIGRVCISNGSYNYLSGEIAEIIALNTTDIVTRNEVYNYLFSKYNFIVNLGEDIELSTFCNYTIDNLANINNASYLWNTGETTSTITVNANGLYSVTVTNNFGVTSIDTINIAFPTVTQTHDTTICTGDTIIWNTSLPSDNYTFQWFYDNSSPQNTEPLTPNFELQPPNAELTLNSQLSIFNPGRYFCVITDSLGCTFTTDTITITTDDYPLTTTLGDDTSLCVGNSIKLQTNADQTIEYAWNTESTTPSITLSESGSYSVTTTNTRGCHAIDTINITILGTAPEINYSVDNLCFRDSTHFIGNAQSEQGIESYSWIINDHDTVSTQEFSYRFQTIGQHEIKTIVTSNNTCQNDSSFSITIKDIPYPNFTYTPVCSGIPMEFVGTSIIPEGTEPTFYTWTIDGDEIGDGIDLITSLPTTSSITYSILLDNDCSNDTTIQVEVRTEYTEPRFVSPAFPANNMDINNDTINLLWNADYDILYYKLSLSTDQNSAHPDTFLCENNTISFPSQYFIDTTYFWSVTAYNHCLDSLQSQEYSFTKKAGSESVANNLHLQLWLKADSVDIIDGKVSRWFDLSNNNIEISQSSAAARPSISESAINRYPAISFNGTNNFLTSSDTLDIKDDGWSWFIFSRYNSKSYSNTIVPPFVGKYNRNASDWNNGNHWFLCGNEIVLRENGNTSFISTSARSACYQIFNYELYDTADNRHKIYINNILTNSHAATTGTKDNNVPFQIGRVSISNGSYNFLSGEIAEIIAFNNIDSTRRNNIYEYLYTKYNSVVSLGLDIHTNGFCDTAITTAYNPAFISYLWSTGETDSVIHVSRTGTYSVTVTNSFGVTSTDDINVYFPEYYQLHDTTICAGDTIIWDLKMNPDDYNFEWFYNNSSPQNSELTLNSQLSIFNPGRYFCVITDSLGCTFTTDTITITLDNYPLTAGFSTPDTLLCVGNHLRIDNNFNETATFQWNNGSTSPDITLTENGTYSVSITNFRGCTAESTVNVSLNGHVPYPNFSIEGHCQNEQLTISDLSTSVQGDIIEHRWFANDSLIGNSDNITHSFNQYGNQNIRLFINTTDNCFNDTTISIHIDPLPQPNISPKYFCQNNDTKIFSTTTIPEGSIDSNTWVIGEQTYTGDSITSAFASFGIMPISISSTSALGCSATSTINVDVLAAEHPAISIIGTCLGDETQFIDNTPFSNINPPISWEWEIDTVPTLQATSLTDNSQLSTPNSQLLTPRSQLRTSNSSLSAPHSQLPTPNSSLSTPHSQLPTPNSSLLTHSFPTSGTFPLSLSVTYANHCTARLDTTVDIHPTPQASIIATDGCTNTFGLLTAETESEDSIYLYRWQIDSTFSATGQSIKFYADSATTYNVTLDITTEFSCTTQVRDSIAIHEIPSVSFTQSRDWGGNPLFIEFENTSEGATSYNWNFGDAGSSTQRNPYFIFTAPGTYTITLRGTNEYGCSDTYSSAAITVVEPIIDVMLMNLKVENQNSFAKAHVTIVNLSTLPVEDLILELKVDGRTLHETIPYLAPGEVHPHTFATSISVPTYSEKQLESFSLCVTAIVPDVEGHSDINLVNNTVCTSGAENLSTTTAYPSPASDFITCEFHTQRPTDVTVSIFNSYGELMRTDNYDAHNGYQKYTASVSTWTPGLYFIRISTPDETITHKFEIVR